MQISYEIEADWVLLRTCNFRCRYCAIPPEELGGKIHVHATASEWLEAFKATGKSWLLHITGGEPSVYPGFVELCERLTENHYLSLNTNFSNACLDEFCEKVDPSRVHYINAALHYEERLQKDSIDIFIKRALRFKERDFNVLISSVITPTVAGVFGELEAQFEGQGLFVIPKVMRGWYAGKLYPNSYTRSERTLIRGHLARARGRYATILARMGEPPTINMFMDERFLRGIPNYGGSLCASGSKFVEIEPNGDVFRCSSGQMLGNVLKKNLILLNNARRCDTSYCPYFCEKYTSPPFAIAQPKPKSHTVTYSIAALVRRTISN
jgi:MoaA/NifB/PqqE/SkfB family radical SAM enzyme